MIDLIISGISNTLYDTFGYENFSDEIHQGLDPPCFFVSCIDPSIQKYIGTRYLKKNRFVIQFFPGSDDIKNQCYRVGEKMFECLEVIRVDDFFLHATKMKFEIIDNVLHFFVDYNAFVRKVEQEQDAMGIMQNNIRVRE